MQGPILTVGRETRNRASCCLQDALSQNRTQKESHSLQNPCKEGASARKINTLYLNIFTSLSNIIHPFHFRDDAWLPVEERGQRPPDGHKNYQKLSQPLNTSFVSPMGNKESNKAAPALPVQ